MEKKEYYLYVKGKAVPVNEEVYKAYWKITEHEKYLQKKDWKNNVIPFSSLDHDGHFVDNIIDEKIDLRKIVEVKIQIEELHKALATLTKPYQIGFLFSFLDLLGTVVPPLAGIILVDFYLLHKKNYPMLEETEFKGFNAMTWISWVVSIVLANILPIGLPSLTGLVLGGIIYFILMKVTGKKVFRKIGE